MSPPDDGWEARMAERAAERRTLSRRRLLRRGTLTAAGAAGAAILARAPVAAAATPFPAAPGIYIPYTPTLIATTTNPTDRAASAHVIQPAVGGTGSQQIGEWTRIGDAILAEFTITLGQGFNPGFGAWRISLPAPTTAGARARGAAVGTGHLHRASAGFLGMGPGAYPVCVFHVNSNVDATHAGIVINGLEIPGAYSDQTTNDNPWPWKPGDQIIGILQYRTVHA